LDGQRLKQFGAFSPSVALGVGQLDTIARNDGPPSRSLSPPPRIASWAVGVGQVLTASVSVSPSWRGLASGRRPAVEFADALLSEEVAVGHAEDEDARPLMACADFSRSEQASLNRKAQAL